MMIRNLMRSLKPKQSRVAKLEARIAQLEKNPFEYTGIYQLGEEYRKGQFATYQGSIWFCHDLTTSRPGDDDAWQLCVKRGQNGKDAR